MTLMYKQNPIALRKLIEIDDKYIYLGTYFLYYEYPLGRLHEFREILLCESRNADFAFEFFVTSGYRSGSSAELIPNTSQIQECGSWQNARRIKTSWLIKNWYKHIAPTSNLHEVYVTRREADDYLPTNK